MSKIPKSHKIEILLQELLVLSGKDQHSLLDLHLIEQKLGDVIILSDTATLCTKHTHITDTHLEMLLELQGEVMCQFNK